MLTANRNKFWMRVFMREENKVYCLIFLHLNKWKIKKRNQFLKITILNLITSDSLIQINDISYMNFDSNFIFLNLDSYYVLLNLKLFNYLNPIN